MNLLTAACTADAGWISTNIAVPIVGTKFAPPKDLAKQHGNLLSICCSNGVRNSPDIKSRLIRPANGTTWYDCTNYYEILSASDENLRWAIDMEADGMVNSKYYRRSRIKIRRSTQQLWNRRESQSSVLMERVISSMYLWYNMEKSTIGETGRYWKGKADNLKAFYKKYYGRIMQCWIVAGKFDEKTKRAVCTVFPVPVPRPARKLSATYTVEPPQDAAKKWSFAKMGDIRYIGMGYHTPAVSDKDCTANDALIKCLWSFRGVYKNWVEPKSTPQAYSGWPFYTAWSGLTYFQVGCTKTQKPPARQPWTGIAADAIPLWILRKKTWTRAKNRTEILKRYGENNRFCYRSYWYIGAGDWRLWFWNRDQLENWPWMIWNRG